MRPLCPLPGTDVPLGRTDDAGRARDRRSGGDHGRPDRGMMDGAGRAGRVRFGALGAVPAEDLPAVALYLAALQGRAAARSLTACSRAAARPGGASEALLDVREAAIRLNF